MNRIKNKFAELNQNNRKALIPYITAGDPQPTITVPLLHALVQAGADIIELGIPFSDPTADGPIIESAHQRALQHKITLSKVFELVAEFRQKDTRTPIVLMGYLNPIEKMGYMQFAKNAAKAGVDGLLIVDLPPEEAEELLKHLHENKIAPIFLIAPTTSSDRIQLITKNASGYLYYISLKGVTGSKALDVKSVDEYVTKIKQVCTLPIAVGFGIKDANSAAQVAKIADAVIVGSTLVAKIAELKDQPEKICDTVAHIVKEMRSAIDQ